MQSNAVQYTQKLSRICMDAPALKTSLPAPEIAAKIFAYICHDAIGTTREWEETMKKLGINPFSGWCREYAIATLLLCSDSEKYDVFYADEDSCDETGNHILGAKCHYWLALKSDHDAIVDPTWQQFRLGQSHFPLPYEYLTEDEIRVVANPFSDRLIQLALPFAKKIHGFIVN